MRKGIHRGYETTAMAKAWVAVAPGEVGEWISEDEYRKAGYSPEFDRLPTLVVRRLRAEPLRVQVYVFKSGCYARSETVTSVAPLNAVALVFGGGGLEEAAGLEAVFGGSAYFENEDTGENYLGVWGSRNGGAFRRRIREAGISVEIVAHPPPARLKWFNKGARGERPNTI